MSSDQQVYQTILADQIAISGVNSTSSDLATLLNDLIRNASHHLVFDSLHQYTNIGSDSYQALTPQRRVVMRPGDVLRVRGGGVAKFGSGTAADHAVDLQTTLYIGGDSHGDHFSHGYAIPETSNTDVAFNTEMTTVFYGTGDTVNNLVQMASVATDQNFADVSRALVQTDSWNGKEVGVGANMHVHSADGTHARFDWVTTEYIRPVQNL